MNLKKYLPFALTGSLIAAGVGYLFTHTIQYGICIYEGLKRDPACLNFYDRIGVPAFYGFGALAIVFALLLVVPKAIPAWKKFAKWYVPVAALILIFYPTNQSMDFLTPSLGIAAQWIAGIYLVVSLAIIIRASK